MELVWRSLAVFTCFEVEEKESEARAECGEDHPDFGEDVCFEAVWLGLRRC